MKESLKGFSEPFEEDNVYGWILDEVEVAKILDCVECPWW